MSESNATTPLPGGALEYARLGWQVFPCHPTEHHPLVQRGFYAATNDPNVITSWWSRWPDAAIGLRTGETASLFAVDIDPRNGGDVSLALLESEHGPLPETVESQTGGGGRHVLLSWPDQPVPCSVSKIGPGIDVKGDGGYIILPPSDHKSGRKYCWLCDQAPDEHEIVAAPAWLLEMIDAPASRKTTVLPQYDRQYDSAVGDAVGNEAIPEGYRNKKLASLAGHMRQVGMGEEEIKAALLTINRRRCTPQLEVAEVEKIAASIARYDPDVSRQAHVEHWPERYRGDPGMVEHGVPVFRFMNDIEIEDIDWMWCGFLAGGKLAIISGDPGTGKSTIAVDLAARISTGADWPDGSPGCEPGSVILLNKEDAPEDTIKPRLKLAGADMAKVCALEGVKQAGLNRKETVEADFNLDRDLCALERLLQHIKDCRLVVVDPIGNYMGQANSHNDAAVRSVLGPLAKLAMKYGVAVLAVAHLNKDSEKAAIYRTLGSVGFVGIARMVFGAVLDPDDPAKKRHYLLPIKSNIGSDRLGMAYAIEIEPVGETLHPKIVWQPEPVTIGIDDLASRRGKSQQEDTDLSGMTGPSPKAEKLTEAVEWLVWRLASGELATQDVLARARRDGISGGTLDRAKKELGIQPRKQGFGKEGGWFWALPDSINPADYLGDDWEQQLDNGEAAEAAPPASATEAAPKALNDPHPAGGIPTDADIACASMEQA